MEEDDVHVLTVVSRLLERDAEEILDAPRQRGAPAADPLPAAEHAEFLQGFEQARQAVRLRLRQGRHDQALAILRAYAETLVTQFGPPFAPTRQASEPDAARQWLSSMLINLELAARA